MDISLFDQVAKSCEALGVDLSAGDLASYVVSNKLSEAQVTAITDLFRELEQKKYQTAIETLLRLSRLPTKVPKTFESFDFNRIHGKDSECVRELPMLSEIHAGKNIAFIGPPGVGKTHLAEAYGRACCFERMKVYFLKASELKDKFLAARKDGREANLINSLVKPSCLIIDEIGYMPIDQDSANLFFQVIAKRYEKHCTIITTNTPFSKWGDIFGSPTLANAVLDRLLHHSQIVSIKGPSYRLKEKRAFIESQAEE